MKTISMLTVLIAFMLTTQAQKSNIPPVVKTALEQKFPGAEKVKWSREGANEYEAEFKLNDQTVSANFDGDGNWKETESPIPFSDLPEPVVSNLQKNYPNANIKEVLKVEQPGRTFFEVTVKVKGKRKEVEINADGNSLKDQMP